MPKGLSSSHCMSDSAAIAAIESPICFHRAQSAGDVRPNVVYKYIVHGNIFCPPRMAQPNSNIWLMDARYSNSCSRVLSFLGRPHSQYPGHAGHEKIRELLYVAPGENYSGRFVIILGCRDYLWSLKSTIQSLHSLRIRTGLADRRSLLWQFDWRLVFIYLNFFFLSDWVFFSHFFICVRNTRLRCYSKFTKSYLLLYGIQEQHLTDLAVKWPLHWTVIRW